MYEEAEENSSYMCVLCNDGPDIINARLAAPLCPRVRMETWREMTRAIPHHMSSATAQFKGAVSAR